MQFSSLLNHQKIKEVLIHEAKSERISHAQMFLGEEGNGALPLSIAFAQFLLCENPLENDSCGVCPSCTKVNHFVHPDVHFVFPVVNSKTNKVSTSDDRRSEWNQFSQENTYFGLKQWLDYLDEKDKSAIIGVDESKNILKKLSLKSYSGIYKIMIIWLPEKMNASASNKLLKILEEPPEKTLFFLVCESTENILPTIISRTQILKISNIGNTDITGYLMREFDLDESNATAITNLAQGNLVAAIDIAKGDQDHGIYFTLFIRLMRAAYAIKPIDLMQIADELAALPKEKQKNFIIYGLHIFRESIMMNYQGDGSKNIRKEEKDFLSKFARFINNQNIDTLMDEFNQSYYHIERNANTKILFSDLVLKLTKLIKKGV